MAIKFPLEMKDGVQVRNILDLKENFDVEKIVGYFLSGKLKSWLEARYYEEEADAIANLKDNDPELAKKLCEIFDVKYEYDKKINHEELVRQNERKAKLKQFTDDLEILENIDDVAFDQEELADLYDKGIERIYLCEGEFFIPKSKQNIEYILIGKPLVVGLKNDDKKLSNDESKEKSINQSFCLTSKECNEDYIFEKLADVIGWNDYVVTDKYIVFLGNSNSFEDNLPPLDIDENYVEGEEGFKVWDIRKKKLSSFKLTGYEDYRILIGATGNKIVLRRHPKANDVLVYDIETQKAKLTCENLVYSDMILMKRESSISVYNGRIAYIDENKNMYCIDLESYEKVFIDNLDEISKKIVLNDNSLFYIKENKIFQYEFSNKQKKMIENYVVDSDVFIDELILHEEKMYIIERKGIFTSNIIILEIDLKDFKKKCKEVFRAETSERMKCKRKDSYYIILKEESGYPVYAFNANLGTVNKILSNCGYTTSETHFFKSTDYYHHGYSFHIVGNYLFYNKTKDFFDKNYFRLNMLTGECIAQKKKNDN